MPKSLLEAAACARPMIAADVPGCREVVIDGKTGLLVPPDNIAALADAMDTLATSKDRRRELAAHARALAETRFGSETVATQVRDLYASIVRESAEDHAHG